MYVLPNKNKDGKIISYRFQFHGKNPLTQEYKLYTKTWKVPTGLLQKEVYSARDKARVEYEEYAKKLCKGYVENEKILFNDFADEYLDKLKNKPEAISTYMTANTC